MQNRLYVGGLSWGTNDAGLLAAFSQAGNVVSAKVIMDRMSGRSKGFGFVEMASDEEAQAAIAMWNGKDLEGRTVTVNVARPMEDRPQRSGGFDQNRRDFNRGSRGGFSAGRDNNRGGGFGRGANRGGSGFRRGSR